MKKNQIFRNNGIVVILSLFFVGVFLEINAVPYLIMSDHSLPPPIFGQEMEMTLDTALNEFYQTKTSESQIHLMWLGNHKIDDMEGFASAGYLIKTNENIILIDSASLLDNHLDKVEKIDVILVTHTHGDHFIPESTVALQKKTGSIVIANPAAYSMIQASVPSNNLFKMEPNTTKEITFGGSEDKSKRLKIQSFLAEHPVKQPLVYLFEIDGFRIFHGADSGFVTALDEIDEDVHISLVPTGDPSPTASPQSAYQMVKSTNPFMAYTMHGSDSQNEEFVSLVQEDISLNTIVVVPKQYQIITPSEVVPEFPSSIIIMLVGILILVLIARYSKHKIDLSKIVFKRT